MSRLSFCAPSDLRAHLPTLLSNGACLVLPGLIMPVPIPVNECIVLQSGRLLWGTCHTPFGPAKPCIGQIDFAGWRFHLPKHQGCEFLDGDGHVIATLLTHTALLLTESRATRLRVDQARHEHRAATESAYASRWTRQFREANDSRPPIQ